MSPPPPANRRQPCLSVSSLGFTLVELLTVVGLMAILALLAVPAFNAIRGGNDFTSQLYDVSGTLERARAYAMSANSYVLVGVIEVSSTLSTSAVSQPAAAAGTVGGRITMAVVASNTGARPYQNDLENRNFGTWPGEYGNGLATAGEGGFAAPFELMQLKGLHMVDLQGSSSPPASGNMARPTVQAMDDIPNAACASANTLGWPLGETLSAAQYSFSKVIEFDPQGSARVIGSPYWDAIPPCIEIGLQPTRGGGVAAPGNQTSGQIAAIQIDGMSGAIHIYRP